KKEGRGDWAEGEITPMDLEYEEMLYEVIETEVANLRGRRGFQDMLQGFTGMTLLGHAWVSSVEAGQGGGWQVGLDVDPPENRQGGAEITATTVLDQPDAESPPVGEKVRFEGSIRKVDISGQRPHVYISRAKLTTQTAKE
ncbi:MAG: hypothetical protein KAX44_06030, partial [Candidatus Brocadiae bacterium]|nr:hypothetical protein [Candidatus Brocadiia bacterium]